MIHRLYHLFALAIFALPAWAQDAVVVGRVSDGQTGQPVEHAQVYIEGSGLASYTRADGRYRIDGVAPGRQTVAVYFHEKKTSSRSLALVPGTNTVDFVLEDWQTQLDEVVVEETKINNAGIRRLQGLEDAGIYEAKKTEVIDVGELTANLATNNPRQIFAKVPGLNIWESDGAGLQLGIGARGLDPNRTSNFNVRQNGYDISADALGYPESYYTPPAEALDRIEVVRGAASLQYGTQFGGLLNFKMKSGAAGPLEVISRQTVGSFGLFNSFNSVGGSKDKISYYAFYQHKQGDGWRPHSGFDLDAAYGAVRADVSERLTLTGQYTYMHYLAQQPGGLTDAMFEEDPRQSIRSRNWFEVNWNLFALLADLRLADQWKLNARFFGLLGSRDALGNLGRIDRADTDAERDLFSDQFRNGGAELRVIHPYTLASQPSVLLIGTRYYHGFTHRRQGLGPAGSDPDFQFLNPDALEGSDFDFPGHNASVFAENIFNLSTKFSVTPGLRFEYIRTRADGYYQDKVLRPNPETGIAEDSVFNVSEVKDRDRALLIAGVGLSYKPNDLMEWYGNFSQNYRAINFNDIRVVNPNLVVDPDIRDERGFNMDLGVRGGRDGVFNFDVSVFYLRYNGRIGAVLLTENENFRVYRYRTNVADSRHVGIEAFGQADLLSLARNDTDHDHKLFLFGNVALIDARYLQNGESTVAGNDVELVPAYNVKTGLSWAWKNLQVTYQAAFTASQFSDATNATFTPSAVEGLIPAYQVMDLSAKYSYRLFTLEAGVNNLANEIYFTRRAAGYPGPGILPSDGRNFYVTLQLKL